MDHSYRAVNGNVADGPPSTIQIMNNGHGGSYYPDVYAAPPAAPGIERAEVGCIGRGSPGRRGIIGRAGATLAFAAWG